MEELLARRYPDTQWSTVPCHIRSYRRKRWQWTKVFGVDPGDLWFLHRCRNGLCWEPLHVYLGTVADNNADTYRENPDLAVKRSASTRAAMARPGAKARISEVHKDRPWSPARRAAHQRTEEVEASVYLERAALQGGKPYATIDCEQRTEVL